MPSAFSNLSRKLSVLLWTQQEKDRCTHKSKYRSCVSLLSAPEASGFLWPMPSSLTLGSGNKITHPPPNLAFHFRWGRWMVKIRKPTNTFPRLQLSLLTMSWTCYIHPSLLLMTQAGWKHTHRLILIYKNKVTSGCKLIYTDDPTLKLERESELPKELVKTPPVSDFVDREWNFKNLHL